MHAIRSRMHRDDSGLSLIEVVVALMVFGIVAIGVAYTLASTLTLTRDSRSRAVAANLAAEVIDNARSIENVFSVQDDHGRTREVGGVTYHVDVDTGWVTSKDNNAQCGAAAASNAGALEYKRVNVEVTWDGMRKGTTPVRSDTLIAPNTRLNDPTLGSVLVRVQDSYGNPVPGIEVTTTPAGAGAAVVPQQGLPTDSEGCSYVLKVVPGNYTVKLTKLGYVDQAQTNGSSSTSVTVAAGGSGVANFQFAKGATITARYPAGAMIPTNLQTTFSTTYGDKVMSTNPVVVHPFDKGYQLVAGALATNGTCKSPDPAAWPVGAGGAIGTRADPLIVEPGALATIDLALGRVLVTKSGLSGKTMTAVLQNAAVAGGDPGCTTPSDSAGNLIVRYTFASASSNTVTLALPYGTYKLYFNGSNNLDGTVLNSAGTPVGTASQVVTIDPRVIP